MNRVKAEVGNGCVHKYCDHMFCPCKFLSLPLMPWEFKHLWTSLGRNMGEGRGGGGKGRGGEEHECHGNVYIYRTLLVEKWWRRGYSLQSIQYV